MRAAQLHAVTDSGGDIAAAIPRASLVVLPIEGHFPHVVAPASVTAALEGFALEGPG